MGFMIKGKAGKTSAPPPKRGAKKVAKDMAKAAATAAALDAATHLAKHAAKPARKRRKSRLGRTLVTLGLVVGTAALVNAFIFYRTPPLTTALDGGDVRYYPTPDGDVFYQVAGDGPPLLLVHGIGAGCSSAEWAHVWNELAKTNTVYALDLLGFGKSDKPALDYTDATYIKLLADFCRDVVGVGEGKGEADVIASSLSAAYVVALSRMNPALFRRLVLVCPTGIEELAKPLTMRGTLLKTLLSLPVVGTTLYNLVSSRASIKTYLEKRIYSDPAKVTEDLVQQYHTSAHQPGGDRVLPSFISGYLNIAVADAFRAIEEMPLLVWGQNAVQTPVGQAEPFLKLNPNAKLEVIPDAGLLPHDEQPEAFLVAVRPFLKPNA